MFVCSAGHFCPNGTQFADQFPCDPGFFNPYEGASSQNSCISCLPGKYCLGYGLTNVSGNCTAGWYCSGGAAYPNTTSHGGRCSPGYYCPEGSSEPLSCPPGTYCEDFMLAEPSGNCSAGYYCPQGMSMPAPSSFSCPPGHYCPSGNGLPLPCPPGTYSVTSHNQQMDDCLLCTAGQYCSNYSNTAPNGLCDAGYYCPPGQTTPIPSEFTCTVGHYCLQGSPFPLICPSGSYQNYTGQSTCSPCPEGHFCDSTESIVILGSNTTCPPGHYCPLSTASGTDYPCPEGTYSNATGLVISTQCTECDAGFHCNSTGLTVPTGPCSAGYYCRAGAMSPTPRQGNAADICPTGSYCTEGSSEPQPCPVSTFSPVTGLTNQSDCTPCTAGHYCQLPGLNTTSGPCSAGYYCPEESNSPTQIICPCGSYCPLQSSRPVGCPLGTYSNSTGLEAPENCSLCTPGRYCGNVGLVEPSGNCSAGFFCPPGQSSAMPSQYVCPIGSYCVEGISVPVTCEDGFYTNQNGSLSCLLCPGGYYCTNGVITLLCPMGFYCPSGTGLDWSPCPHGTYSNQIGLNYSIQCMPCDGGSYCNRLNATAVSGDCSAGFYCTRGVDTATPVNYSSSLESCADWIGDICPIGHYCPTATVNPMPCPAGSYANETGLSSCLPCPEGFFCLLGTSDYTVNQCQQGYYCPEGTEHGLQYPCPAGTYSNASGLISESQCKLCPPGHFCGIAGLTWYDVDGIVAGMCSAGYYCTLGSPSAMPSSNSTYGSECTPGYYCPSGSGDPQPCDPGFFCSEFRLFTPEGSCSQGYYCLNASISNQPTDGVTGDTCPRGNFCPEQSSLPTPCPPGTYSNQLGNVAESDCNSCPPGSFCDSYQLTMPAGSCSGGFYCPGGQNSSTPAEYVCPRGHYCPPASIDPSACQSGFYQYQVGQTSCLNCPERYYCDATSGGVASLAGLLCLPGFFCPEGTIISNEFPCPVGSYSDMTGLSNSSQCSVCPAGHYCAELGITFPTGLCMAGYYCVEGSETATPSGYECPRGHFCPNGTHTPFPCPVGTYSNVEKLTSELDCFPCSKGMFCNDTGLIAPSGECTANYYCNESSTTSTPMLCPAGYYCEQGAPDPQPCPIGTYSSTEGLSSVYQCILCTPGYFCEGLALLEPSGICEDGYHCPKGSPNSRPSNFSCPIGHACPSNSSLPVPCSEGTYNNQTHSTQCYTCPAGFYCLEGLLTGRCPRGFYCPLGTGYNWFSCPMGTYSNKYGLSSELECTLCDGGSYCDQLNATGVSGSCLGGHYCLQGNTRPDPHFNISSDCGLVPPLCAGITASLDKGGVCTVGHYCPGGTTIPLPCPPGTYSNTSGLSACLSCPEGYYCLEGSSTYANTPCTTGYYCPEGTEFSTQFPCQPGTYNNESGLKALTECLDCPGGWYCEGEGLTEPTGLCFTGHYCTARAQSGSPNATSHGGGRCERGFYCPGGTSTPIPCTPGSYCVTDGLGAPSDFCDAGYYCRIGSSTATPNSSEVGGVCSEGHYCPVNSTSPTPCPPGTYSNNIGNQNISDCDQCTPGYYCDAYNLSAPIGLCNDGYFCPGGQATPTPSAHTCSQGHYCVRGSHEPVRCDSGSYQDETGQSRCKGCPPAYFCDNTIAPVTLYNDSLCPAGSYCPQGTRFSIEYLCPIGTFGDLEGLQNISQCTPCTPTMYCSAQGLTAPTGKCSAGYFCISGASSATPEEGENANICPRGFYCTNATSNPTPCPIGTYSNMTGLLNSNQCTPCDGGYYCNDTGQTEPSGLCSPSYYCPLGSSSYMQEICPSGFVCPEGTHIPTGCPIGSYSNQNGLRETVQCNNCTEGSYCNETGLTQPSGPCSPGYYCPEGTVSATPSEYVCSNGSYCPGNTSLPITCPAGMFTDFKQASECFPCPSGWYCLGGHIVDNCPFGYYCPEGTGDNWQPCSVGTYSNLSGLASVIECQPCPGGYHCSGTALTSPSGLCSEGYYCTSGSPVATPTNYSLNVTVNSCLEWPEAVGDICPMGHYCIAGSSNPIPCPAGSYGPVDGLDECIPCPAGFYCTVSSVDYSDKICPSGYYCPEETEFATQYPCLPSTFNPSPGASNQSSCQSCTPGSHCSVAGLSAVSGPCAEGYYCSGATNTSTPGTFQEGGGRCDRGFYCPEGSSSPTPCVAGSYCAVDGLSAPSGVCDAGYYCVMTSDTATPTNYPAEIGGACTVGHYCLANSSTPTPCPPGTYSNSTSNIAVGNCLPCPVGMFCAEHGLTAPEGTCSAGFYCPGGQVTGTPTEYQCPAGHFCLEGSPTPSRCSPGTYQNLTTQSNCLTCPPSYFCDSTFSPVISLESLFCPAGSYCPEGTQYSTQHQCPPGTYGNVTGLSDVSQCTLCSAGMFCPLHGHTSPSGPCHEGYYCLYGANSSTPNQGTTANVCPEGHYCPTGTVAPINCPRGAFNPLTMATALSDCQNCPGGKYCNASGLLQPTGNCDEGYFCPEGSTNSSSYLCSTGHYCPASSGSPTPCPAGTYSSMKGLARAADCTVCTPGNYCIDEGLSQVSGLCSGGFYCPGGNLSPNPSMYVCEPGFVCPEGSSAPQSCSSGTFTNQTGQSSCQQCPPGFYCLPVDINNITLAYQPCPQGYYCPPGTGIDWKPCPLGTYSNTSGLSVETECTPCPGGYYCSELHSAAPADMCHAGYYCNIGSSQPEPSYMNTTESIGSSGDGAFCNLSFPNVVTGQCTQGHYCPIGSSLPLPCLNGTYSSTIASSSCDICPAGYYCPGATVNYTDYVCPSGHYCTEGTKYATEFPCPVGTFNSYHGATNISGCIECLPGSYCSSEGQANVTGLCDPGYYCAVGASIPQPIHSTTGGRCNVGQYCPRGSSMPLSCDPGYYCGAVALSNVSGSCQQGHYCTGNATTATPTDGITGDICPPGNYCPAKSTLPIKCPLGTYLNFTGATSITNCMTCLSGQYCDERGLSVPTGLCSSGYYCPSGQNISTPQEYVCPLGHFCEEGATVAVRCPSGFYQDEIGQDTCKPCPTGVYCNSTVDPVTTSFGTGPCPEGYYCPEETEYSRQFPCPVGTFSDATGLGNSSQCTACSAGYYCPMSSLTSPFANCSAGYFCRAGATSASPNQGHDANVCPRGFICAEGTAEPEPCPPGTFSNQTGVQVSCEDCPAGMYCSSSGLTQPTGVCSEGYYCPSSSTTSTEIICPQGSYCLMGSSLPMPCPTGTFSSSEGLTNSSECLPCTAGMFCNITGLVAPSGSCYAGYFCPQGSSTATPMEYICPVGLHCPVGSSEPQQCQLGSYTDITGASTCSTCPAGSYCVPVNQQNATLRQRLCPSGFYCPAGTGLNWLPCPSRHIQ